MRKDIRRFYIVRFLTASLALLLLLSLLLSATGCEKRAAPAGTAPADEQSGNGEEAAAWAPQAKSGTLSAYSTYVPGQILHDGFYYDDAWFEEAPETQNDALALLSMQLVAAAVTGSADGPGAQALSVMGFENIGFENFNTSDPDDCAYTRATRRMGDCTLVVVVMQSYTFDKSTKVKGWKQNFTVNDDTAAGEHAALAAAAEKVLADVAGIAGGPRKYWIIGQSRGGALANLIAAKLPAALGADDRGIYGYTFEAPAVTEAALNAAGRYDYIHNYIAGDDFVANVPVWGMVRYGVDHEIRTDATEAALRAELEKLGSSLAVADVTGRSDEQVAALTDYLQKRISSGRDTPARADYSATRVDTVANADGTQTTVTYSYQEALTHLMGAIFSGAFGGLPANTPESVLPDLSASVYLLADAIDNETTDPAASLSQYRQAAKGLYAVMNGLFTRGLPDLTETDVYALLRLAGPLMIDAGYVRTGDADADAAGMIHPLIEWAQSVGDLTYSHHFDTALARLHARAPLPAITAPAAGDAAVRAR